MNKDSIEHLNFMIKDLGNLKLMIENNQNSDRYVQIKRAVDNEIDLLKHACNNAACNNCFSYRANIGLSCGAACEKYGIFPENIDVNKYKCCNWRFDDVPF